MMKTQQHAGDSKQFNMTSVLKKKLLEFYKERYEAEADRREKSTERLTFSLLILSIIANILLTYLGDLPPFVDDGMTRSFYIGLSLAVIVGGAAVYFYVRALIFRYDFWYLPSPKQISEFLKESEEYNQDNPPDPINLDAEFDERLTDQYRDYATDNAALNDRRSTFIYKTSLCSIISLVLLLVCAPVFFLKKHDVQKVEIVKPVNIEPEQHQPPQKESKP